MDKERFSTLLKDPSQVTDVDIKALNEYRKKYPYFQSLYVVLAKVLKDREHPKTEPFIKKAAIYSANRPYLKEIIEGEYSFVEKKQAEPIQDSPISIAETEKVTQTNSFQSKKIEEQKVETTSIKSDEIKSKAEVEKEQINASSNIKEGKVVDQVTIRQEKKKVSLTKEEETSEEEKSARGKRILPKAQEIVRDIKEIEATKIRIESLLSGVPIDEENGKLARKLNVKKKNQIEIIEKFIQNEPQIDRIKLAEIESSTGLEDLASKSLKSHEAFETETLAQLMIKQGKLKRAKDIYEKLSLKFPEKSAYFASQIQKIKSE